MNYTLCVCDKITDMGEERKITHSVSSVSDDIMDIGEGDGANYTFCVYNNITDMGNGMVEAE